MNLFAVAVLALVVILVARRLRPAAAGMDFRSFAFVFQNPVFNRELLTGLRSPRLRWILLLYLVVPFVVIAGNWPENAVFYGGSDLAVDVWQAYLFGQLWLVALLTPIFAAYSVSSEFQQDTAEMLWITRLPAPAIVIGKMAAVVLLCVALLVASLASLSLVFYLGGVGVSQILGGFVILLCAVIFTTSVAVFYSSRTRQGHLALVLTYCTLLVSSCFITPLFGLMISGRGSVMSWGWFPAILVSLFFVAAAAGCANKPIGEKARANFKPIDDFRQLRLRRRSWPYYLVDPMRRLPPMPEGGNVIAHHEWRIHPLHRSEWGYRCITIAGALTAVLLFWQSVDALSSWNQESGRTFSYILWWLNFVVVVSWTVLLHAVSMTLDQELGTLESLRLTSVGPMDFLLGKWLGSLRMRWIMIVVGVLGVMLACIIARSNWLRVLYMPLAWWFMVELCGLLTFGVSSVVSKTAAAVALSLVANTAMVAGSVALVFADFDPYWETLIQDVMPFGGESKLVIFKIIIFALLCFACWLLATIGIRHKWKLER